MQENSDQRFNDAVKKGIKSSAVIVKKTLAKQKQAMFDNNTHGWNPLSSKTVLIKQAIAKTKPLYRSPESINIRFGWLYKSLKNSSNYISESSNQGLNFSIKLSQRSLEHAETSAVYNRDPLEMNKQEFDEITDLITEQIISSLSKVK